MQYHLVENELNIKSDVEIPKILIILNTLKNSKILRNEKEKSN